MSFSLAFLTWLAVALTAQIELPKISESVTVSIVNIDVVVTDRAGRHVGGLTKDDFIVSENGKPQEVTNFSEIVAGASERAAAGDVPAEPPRSLVVFLDTGSIGAGNRARVFRALKDFVENVMTARDEAMVASWNRTLKILAPPTHDRAAVLAAIDKAALEVPRSISMEPPALMAPDGPIGPYGGAAARAQELMMQRRAARMTAIDLQQSVRALNAILARMAGTSGRKALLLVSEGFSIRASPDDPELPNLELENQELIESVTRTANAANVTLYTFHAAGPVALTSASDATVSEGQQRVARAANSVVSLQSMAAGTGGLLASGTADFRGAFARVAGDFASYYSIGYRATSDSRSGLERKISVSVRDGRYVVRFRKSFIERSPETQIRDEVMSNLLFPSRTNALRIKAWAGSLKPLRKSLVSVKLEIAIPLPSLTLLPSGDKYAGGFLVYLAAGDADNATSEIVRRSHRISFDAADLPKAMTVAYIYPIEVQTAKGNRISVGVMDEISRESGFASVKVPD